MATVKGDVHDIGKNIVGVVLACNNYEIDRPRRDGVRRQDPGDGARAGGRHHRPLRPHHALARRDGRTWRARWSGEGFKLPLLIGGATTSKAHTAVKIAPAYSQAGGARARRLARGGRGRASSRAPEQREAFVAQNRARAGEAARASTAEKRRRSRCSPWRRRGAGARRIDWASYEPPRPAFTGARVLEPVPLAEIVPFIDWSPFFAHLGAARHLPAHLREPGVGRARRKELFDDAQALLDAIVAEGRLTRPGGLRLLPGQQRGRRHRGLRRRGARAALADLPHPAPADRQGRTASRSQAPGRLRRPAGERARSTTWAPSR